MFIVKFIFKILNIWNSQISYSLCHYNCGVWTSDKVIYNLRKNILQLFFCCTYEVLLFLVISLKGEIENNLCNYLKCQSITCVKSTRLLIFAALTWKCFSKLSWLNMSEQKKLLLQAMFFSKGDAITQNTRFFLQNFE